MKKIFILLVSLLIFVSAAYPEDMSIQAQNAFTDAQEKTTQEQSEQPSQSAILEAEITFDWFDISMVKREEIVENYKNIIFSDDEIFKYKRKEFRKQYSEFLKDKNHKEHYRLASNGVLETGYVKLCAFFYKSDILVIYALQYKDRMKNAFYYDALGRLRFVDVMEGNYPDYPYWSKQYTSNGKMISAIYFVSKDIQYMYEPDGKFQGVWYKDKMYNMDARQVLTRTNW